VATLRQVIALVLAALWPLLTLHCDLEELVDVPFLTCGANTDATPHEDDRCDEDACVQVEKGFYKLDEVGVSIQAPVLCEANLLFPRLSQETAPSRVLAAAFPASEPSLRVTWQFSHRTALPPRAPSFIA